MLFRFSRLFDTSEPTNLNHNPNVANTPAICTIPANSARKNALLEASWSYDSDPTTGFLLIEDGAGNEIAKYWITKGGPGSRKFHFKTGTANRQLIVTLGAVAGVKGTLDVTYIAV